MAVAEELITMLGYDIKGQGKLRQYQQGLDGVEKSATRSAARISAIGARFGGALGGFLVGGAAAAGVASSVKQYASLERQMTRIGQAAGASASETKAATSTVARLANDIALPLDQAYAGLDALVATGKTMPEALAFLPSILRASQASGAATEDMSASANALATSFKVAGGEMETAFDYLVTGGQAGQFELKDMARYLPSLTASAAKLGFTGLDGTKKLVAMLQTVRLVSGTSEEAATAARDALEKMLSPQIGKNLKAYGINIGKVLEDAAKKGENGFEAVIEQLAKLTDGMSDTKRDMVLTKIFPESDSRRAVVAMIKLRKEFKALEATVGAGAGAVDKNLKRVLDDTQASVDRLSNSFDKLKTQLGASVAPVAVPVLDAFTDAMAAADERSKKMAATRAGLTKRGLSPTQTDLWMLNPLNSQADRDKAAREGGWTPERDNAERVLGRPTINRPKSGAPGSLSGLREDSNPGRGGRRRPPAQEVPPWQEALRRNELLMSGDEPLLPANAMPISGAAGVATDMTTTNNNTYNYNVSAPVTVNVQQASQAPAAVGGAVSSAITGAVQANPARMQSGPAAQ